MELLYGPQAHALTSEYILNNMAEGFLLLDEQFNLAYLNERGEDLLRFTNAEVQGKFFYEVFPELRHSVFSTAAKKAQKEQRSSRKSSLFSTSISMILNWSMICMITKQEIPF